MITKILYENIGPHQRLEIHAGHVNIISGPNGVGKTFILRGLQWMVEGGVDEGLIRTGAIECAVTVEFDDGTRFIKTQELKADGRIAYNLSGIGPGGGVIKRPKEALESLIDPIAANPEELITANPRDRVKALLKMVHIEFSPEELAEIFAGDDAIQPPKKPVGIDSFAALVDGTTTRRRDLNRTVRDLEGAVKVAKKSLPNEDSVDWVARRNEKEQALSEVRARIRSANAESGAALAKALATIESDLATKKAELMEQIRREEASAAAVATSIRQQHTEDLANSTAELRTAETGWVEQLAEATAKATASTKAAGIRDSIAKQEAIIKDHTLREIALSKVLERAKLAKAAKLKSLPVDGIDIDGEQILINGIPFDDLNTAQRRAVAWELAQCGGTGGQQIMVIDEGQDFDGPNTQALLEECRVRGLQVFFAEVDRSKPNLHIAQMGTEGIL